MTAEIRVEIFKLLFDLACRKGAGGRRFINISVLWVPDGGVYR